MNSKRQGSWGLYIMSKKWVNHKRIILSIVLVCSIAFAAFSGVTGGIPKVSAASDINNPRITEDGNVTWDLVEFGTYPQTVKGFKTEPIKWRILSVNEDGTDALVLADKGLDAKPYLDGELNYIINHDEMTLENNTWEKCTLRSWLNNDFYNKAFSLDEKNAINISDVSFTLEYSGINNNLNPDPNADVEITQDHLYLLSCYDVLNKDYGFSEDSRKKDYAKVAEITDYAKYIGGEVAYKTGMGYSNCNWWLLGPRTFMDLFPRVAGDFIHDLSSIKTLNCVRPAMHINLNSAVVKSAGEIDSAGNVYDINDGYNNPRDVDGVITWDCVYLGSYEQSAIYEEEPITWRVLSVNKDGTDAFLLADKALDCRPFHSVFTDTVVTWDKSTMRQWLNNEFFENAFSEEERLLVNNHYVKNDRSPDFGTYSGEDTIDKVFLLSISEATNFRYGFNENYDDDDDYTDIETRVAYVTDYAWLHGSAARIDDKPCHWDLRTAGLCSNYNACIHPNGTVLYGGGGGSGSAYSCTRPAICINLNSDLVKNVGTVSASGGTYKPYTDDPDDLDDPDDPIDPNGQVNPVNPDGQVNPVNPNGPNGSVNPVIPNGPIIPVNPSNPGRDLKDKQNDTSFNIKNKSKIKKNSKIIIKDKDMIKKITLNGKKIKIKSNKTKITLQLKKYKKLLKKKSKWNKLVITDKNGNKATLSFKTSS